MVGFVLVLGLGVELGSGSGLVLGGTADGGVGGHGGGRCEVMPAVRLQPRDLVSSRVRVRVRVRVSYASHASRAMRPG